MKKTFIILFYILALSDIFCQESDISDIDEISLDDLFDVKVVTVSKTEQVSSDAPATIHVVTAEQIKNRGYFNLQELLEDIPEIEIQRQSIAESKNLYTLRGVPGNEKFIIMLDGLRINSVIATPQPVSTNYPLANAERVEVIIGPASALYGADAFTGIINIISKKANSSNKVNARASYGSFNSTDNSLVVSGEIGGIPYSIAGQMFRSDGANMPELYEDEFSWYYDQYLTNGQVRQSLFNDEVVTVPFEPEEYSAQVESNFFQVSVGNENLQIGFSRNYESHSSALGVKPEFAIYNDDAVYAISNTSLFLKHKWTNEAENIILNTIVSQGHFSLSNESAFVNLFTGYETAYKYEKGDAFRFEEQLTWLANDKFQLIAGFTFDDFDVLPKTGDLPKMYDENKSADEQELYYLGTNVTDLNGNDLTINQDFYNIDFQNYGAYAQMIYKPIESIGITAGTRFDYNTRFYATFNPRVGVTFNPFDKFKLKLLYGTAFFAPSPYRAYQHYGSMEPTTNENGEITGLKATFWNIPNPDLTPELLSSYEINLAYIFTEQLRINVNGYVNDVTDLITVEGWTNREFKGIPVEFGQSPINKGDLLSYGGTVRFDGFFNIGGSFLNYYLAYTHSDGRITTITGQEIDTLNYSAMNFVKAGIDYRWNNFSISPRIIYRSKSYHPNLYDEDGSRVGSDPFLLMNMFVRYNNLIDTELIRLDVFIKVNNLLNSEFNNVFFGGPEGFVQSLQNPINFLLGFEVNL